MKCTGINEKRVENVCGQFEFDRTKYGRNIIMGYDFIFWGKKMSGGFLNQKYATLYEMFIFLKGM